MGRQIRIRMNSEDERALLAFLRTTSPVQLFASSAPNPDALYVNDFEPELPGNRLYYVWNRTFHWTPQFRQQRTTEQNPMPAYYLANASNGPLLEILRAEVTHEYPGRLYWANDFSAPDRLDYDAPTFSRWIDKIWRWVRKSGTKAAPDEPYVFPGAQRDLQRGDAA